MSYFEEAHQKLGLLNQLDSIEVKKLASRHVSYGIEIDNFEGASDSFLSNFFGTFSKIYWSFTGSAATNTLNLSEEDLAGHQIELTLSTQSICQLLEEVSDFNLLELHLFSEDPFENFGSSIAEFIEHWTNILDFCKRKSLSIVIFVSG